jgi:prephenate dehydratase
MTLATLGPQGTYCHQAALKVRPEAAVSFKESIDAIFSALQESEVDAIVVPLKNTISGEVHETLEHLKGGSVQILEVIALPISHDLVGFGTLEEVEVILAHPHGYRQCAKKIEKLCPSAHYVEAKSNAESALRCLEKKERAIAAIVSPRARELYALPLLASGIEDAEENITYFLLLGRRT